MDNFYLAILVAAIPGIYFAYKKNFIVIPNKKYNIFPIQLLFTAPLFGAFSATLATPLYFILGLFPSFVNSIIDKFGPNIDLLPLMIASIIVFIFSNRFLILKEDPEFDGTKESELYVYFPIYTYRNCEDDLQKAKYTFSKETKGELLLGAQVSDMCIDYKLLEGIDFAFIYSGEIIVSEKVLQILNENELTGIQTRNVQNKKGNNLNEKYYQILPTDIMPKMDPKTEFIFHKGFQSYRRIRDKKVYYQKDVLSGTFDFNQSFEAVGYENGGPFTPQRHWIVSKKARSVLINKLGQNDFDFIPIKLIDE